MGRENKDHPVVHSSIALLQERFRQLQRVKEMREERELLRFFSESERIKPITTTLDDGVPPSKLFFHPDLIIPPGPNQQDSSSHFFRTESHEKCVEFLAVDTPLLMSLWPNNKNRSIVLASNNFEDSDVDTSLHL